MRVHLAVEWHGRPAYVLTGSVQRIGLSCATLRVVAITTRSVVQLSLVRYHSLQTASEPRINAGYDK